MNLELELLKHQALFVQDTTTRDLALVGGRGCGKTYALCIKLIVLAWLQAGYVGAALSPTGPMASKVLIPEMLDALQRLNVKYDFNRSERRFDLFFNKEKTTIYVLSAENVRDGLGLNLAFFGVDEADTMNPDVAFESWRKLSGALRDGHEQYRQKVAVSTPEGYGFMHQHWVQNINDENRHQRRLIRGRTRDNDKIGDDVIQDLMATYPAHYLAAYLNGEFVNMAGRPVYDHYGYAEGFNTTQLTLADVQPNETLHIGMDFNVQGMSATVAVVRGRDIYIVDEQLGAYGTQELADTLKREYRGYGMVVYPDPAGNHRSSSTNNTDHSILRTAGIPLRVMSAHPRVRDRVNSVNAMFLNGQQDRRLHINPKACPGLHKSLITQVWDANDKPKKGSEIGLPSTKKTLIDGPLDALGYFIYTCWPLKGTGSPTIRMTGL
jgi:hypothetical protein